MTLAAKVRTHKLSPNAMLCASGFNMVAADSPAIEAMTDFSRISVVSIGSDASIAEANARMISRGVRMLMVVGKEDEVVGLITARDILGEKPMQIAAARGGKRDDLSVRDLMTAIASIDTLYLGARCPTNSRQRQQIAGLAQRSGGHVGNYCRACATERLAL